MGKKPRLPQSRRIRDRTRSLTTTPTVSVNAEQAQYGRRPSSEATAAGERASVRASCQALQYVDEAITPPTLAVEQALKRVIP
jgi:hypothetical protein